jgi:hypothetical protein
MVDLFPPLEIQQFNFGLGDRLKPLLPPFNLAPVHGKIIALRPRQAQIPPMLHVWLDLVWTGIESIREITRKCKI